MRRALTLLCVAASAVMGQEREEPAAFKTSVRLVTIRVVVRDRQGHASGELRQADFQLTDNGKPQTITRFSVETAKTAPGAGQPPPTLMPARFVAYLVDDLNLAGSDVGRVRTAAARHIRESLGPGDRAAVFSTSGRVTTDFGNDRARLEAALSRLSSGLVRSRQGSCPDIGFYQADLIANRHDPMAVAAAVREIVACNPLEKEDTATRTAEMLARQVVTEGEQRTRVGLAATLDVVRRMETVPGERVVVLVSPGFLTPGLEQQMGAIVGRAIHGGIVVNAIDTRGLWADNSGDASAGLNDLEAARIKRALARDAASAESAVLATLSGGAGGHFLRNTNDLEDALRQAAAAPEYVYQLGFSPSDLRLDGKYHSLKVTLRGARGTTVEARKGYFAPGGSEDPEQRARREIQEAVFSREERGELGIDLESQFETDADLTARTAVAKLAVFTRVDAKTLPLRKAGGRSTDRVAVVSALFDPDGNLVAGKEQLYQLRLSDADLRKAIEDGITARTDFQVKPGTYVLRSVVRESEGERIAARNSVVSMGAGEAPAASRQRGAGPRVAARSSLWKPAEAPPPETEEPDEAAAPGIDKVTVPGGLGALAAVTRLQRVPGPADFFKDYCRAIGVRRGSGRPPAAGLAATYLASIAGLSSMTEREGGRISLSLETDAGRETTVRALAQFGWTVRHVAAGVSSGSGGSAVRAQYRLEPRDQPADSVLQSIPPALGIDSITMVDALAGGGTFTVAIPSAQADFLQERLWKKFAGPLPPGGFAELFARRPQWARAYAGLAAMGPDAAAAVMSGIALRALADKYSDLLWLYGEAFSISAGRAAVPGGSEAEAAWQKLAGAPPKDPKAFFRALLQKDQGRLAAFYHAVSRGSSARQRFFTRTPAAAERFYRWFRDADELRAGAAITHGWRLELLAGIPLDDGGAVRFPGGASAWNQGRAAGDADALLRLAALEALVPVTRIEERRGTRLDARSAALLAGHYGSWRSLFPYFERMPALDAAAFEALARFEQAAAAKAEPERNAVAGEWHALVKLIELGAKAGSLDAGQAAQAFRRACEVLSGADPHAGALAVLAGIAGAGESLEDAVASRLLRLNESRRAAFDRVRQLQQSPPLASARGQEKTVLALAGLVYGAVLEPDSLLVAEDPRLVARHRYVYPGGRCAVFCRTAPEVRSGEASVRGGFAEFEDAVRLVAREKIRVAAAAPAPPAAPPAYGGSAADFRADVRLVEVNATVIDNRGEFVDGLARHDFTVLDNGKPRAITNFENDTAGISVALLLDTSESMTEALAALRKSAYVLVGNLRDTDWAAVYSFSDAVSELQTWTGDKQAARRAIMRLETENSTELHDALIRVIRELSVRVGKKAIVVFSDGDDTSSGLGAEAVVRLAREKGIPIYTVAQGEALRSPLLLQHLEMLGKATGGLSFAIREPREIVLAFERISRDLTHGYLLTFRPEDEASPGWHRLEIAVRGRTVRAREGYYPD